MILGKERTVPDSSVGADAGQSPMYDPYKVILTKKSGSYNDFQEFRHCGREEDGHE